MLLTHEKWNGEGVSEVTSNFRLVRAMTLRIEVPLGQ